MTDEIHGLLHELYDGDLTDFSYDCAWCSGHAAKAAEPERAA
jgi:hypothetical protein